MLILFSGCRAVRHVVMIENLQRKIFFDGLENLKSGVIIVTELPKR